MFWWLPWYTPRSETIKLKSCRNLIQHYLGDFLGQQITLDQLSVNIHKGTGKVCDISLNCEAVNELGKQQNWPIKVVESQMKDISVHIPWKNLLNHDSIFTINGLTLTVQPIARNEPVSSILRWMLLNCSKLYSSKYVFTSYNIEDENQEPGAGQAAKLFAESLNTIQKRLKVKLENTKIRIEHVPRDIDRGFALEFNIKNIYYFDESTSEPIPVRNVKSPEAYRTNFNTNKKIKFEGVTLYMQMYENSNIKEAKNMNEDCPVDMLNADNQASDHLDKSDSRILAQKSKYLNHIYGMLTCTKSGKIKRLEKPKQPNSVLFSTTNEQPDMTLTCTHSDNAAQPAIKLQTMGPFIIVLSPKEIDSVIKIIKSLHKS